MYSGVDITPAYVSRRVFSSCIFQCHEWHRAAMRKAKNKPARKRALMDETSFQPHGALLLPPYFPLLSSTLLCYVVRSTVYAGTTLITSTYPLRATSNHRASEVYALLHRQCNREKDRPEEKHKKQKTNFIWLRNAYSANGDRTAPRMQRKVTG